MDGAKRSVARADCSRARSDCSLRLVKWRVIFMFLTLLYVMSVAVLHTVGAPCPPYPAAAAPR